MLLKLSRFFLFASVFCINVVLWSTFFPFIGGKYYFFRVAVEASLAFFLLWWGFVAKPGELEERFSKVSKSWIFRAVTVFTVVFMLATIFADDPHTAFWSNFERGDGGFQMLHYYAFFFLLVILFRERRDWIKIFKLSIAAAVLMILYGIGAAVYLPGFIGPYRDASGGPSAPTLFGRIFSDSRFQGSLGNPAYVAPYLMFAIFYALYYWYSKKEGKAPWKLVSVIGLVVVFLIFFVLSQTRGAFLGLAAALFIFALYVGFSDSRMRKKAAVGLLVLIVLGAGVYAFRKPLVDRNVPGSRFLTISLSDQTAQTRFWTWGSAWKGFLDRPLLGWGPENFSTVFDKYFDTRHFNPNQNTETWFDHAHSVIFDYLAATGLLGFLAYLSIFAAYYYEFFKMPRREESRDPKYRAPTESVALRGLLFAIPVAYFVQALILFDVLPILINLFIILGFALYEFENTHEQRT
ncbi:MAG: O-antigen ligase family protein [Candidatus Liptonbacteria bacterium]